MTSLWSSTNNRHRKGGALHCLWRQGAWQPPINKQQRQWKPWACGGCRSCGGGRTRELHSARQLVVCLWANKQQSYHCLAWSLFVDGLPTPSCGLRNAGGCSGDTNDNKATNNFSRVRIYACGERPWDILGEANQIIWPKKGILYFLFNIKIYNNKNRKNW